jgi:hypothetical protein
MAEQSGLTVRELMTLQKAFGSVGLDAEAIPTIMSQLSSKIEDAKKGAGPAAEAFARLGLSVADLSGMGGLDQLKAISKALRIVTNDTERLALQRAILGRKGAMAMPALEEGKLGKAEKAVAPMAAVVEQMGGVFIAFQGNIKKILSSFEPFFLGMASQVVPALVIATQDLMAAAPMLLQAGILFGNSIGKLVDVIPKIIKGFELLNSMNPFVKPDPNAGLGKPVLEQIADGFFPFAKKQEKMKADEQQKYEEARKAQLIPGYAEETGATPDAAMTFEERMQKVVESFKKPKIEQGEDLASTTASIGKAIDPAAGLSSLAKMGAIGGGGAPIQDPVAMRSVSIQEDIRNYMRDLVNLVKSPENLSIQSGNPGMVLTA